MVAYNNMAANINLKADFIDATINQLADRDQQIDELNDKLTDTMAALQAFKDFDDLSLESKRPDVFEINVRKPILDTLAKLNGGKE